MILVHTYLVEMSDGSGVSVEISLIQSVITYNWSNVMGPLSELFYIKVLKRRR